MMERKHTTTVAAHNLGKRVDTAAGSLDILSAIDLEIGEGETVAIVGVSGSGKSTLLGLLAGLDQPSSGEVFLSEYRLDGMDEDGRASVRGELVGFVFQSFQLLPGLTALENVMLPLELRGDRTPVEHARALLNDVGLGERLDHYPKQLSGGEQQRVAIARAYVTDPAILFADEPTGNLDNVTGERVIELLLRLNREKGTTLVLVTHDERLAGRCERVVRLEGGRIVADGVAGDTA